MSHRKFTSGENALAGVIEALLLVALVSIVLSTIQYFYVPEIMQEKESEHMNVVENQFSSLKSVVEIQSMMGTSSPNQPLAYVPISSPVTLGNEKLPYFVSVRGTGQVEIKDRDRCNSFINGSPAINTEFTDGKIPFSSIEYQAFNAYYLDGRDLKYIFEGGAIILNQTNGESMIVQPPIMFTNGSTKITVEYSLPVFISPPGKNLTGGFGNCFIRTNYTDNDTDDGLFLNRTKGYRHNLSIYTDHLDAWNQSFNTLFESEIMHGDIKIYKYPEVSPTHVRIQPLEKDLEVYFEIAYIGAQVGPGIVLKN